MNPTLPSESTAAKPRRNAFARFAPPIVRTLMGLAFVVFGLNGFLNFIPQPSTPLAPRAVAFLTALVNTGYMLKLIAVTQLVAGAMLVLNAFVPLALALLAPFLVNSLAFHFCLEPTGRPMAVVFTLLELYLAWRYRASFRPMLAWRARP
ncbi:MAG TPA: DoxX family protein [Opitutaceae bacterium]|nr:DoxX family protein [Opitutaceae bacterium]